jgi:hypothetical protein
MAYMNSRGVVANTGVSARLKQVLVLALTILVGMLISVSVSAA